VTGFGTAQVDALTLLRSTPGRVWHARDIVLTLGYTANLDS
jgi:hypothetical protein